MSSTQREDVAARRSTLEISGTFDIETESWSRFVCGALYRPGHATRVYSWRFEDRFVDDLLALKGTYWAHNGGRYDFLWLIGHLIRRGVPFRISLSGSSVAGLFVGEATFRDSARLVPMSLDKASQIGSVPKLRSGLPCSCERYCGGYCSHRVGMSRRLFNQLAEYCVNDCKATYSMLDALSTLCERWDLDLKSTIGASAWATVKRQGVEVASWGGKRKTHVTRDYTDTRKAYFGGRTQVLRPAAEHYQSYDINSAYPAALASLALPTGERKRLHGSKASAAFSGDRPGVYRAIVHVPRVFFPPLPVRGRARIGFPVGSFSGVWTAVELQAALLRGATLGRVSEALVWSDREMVLAPFCRHVWALRDQAGPKTSLGTWLKLYANSLTGKLATRPEVERIDSDPNAQLLCPADFPCGGILCGMGGVCCPHRACSGACGARQTVATGVPIFVRRFAQLSECSHVEWAAYLTSWTRVQLAKFAGDGEDGVYCDTDSWKCLEPRTENLGTHLGGWKDEGRKWLWEAPAPKTYTEVDYDGCVTGASKGIPDAVRNFHKLRTGVTVDRGVDTFKTAARKGDFFVRKKLTRVINPDGITFGDRKLRSDGRTYPTTVKQLSDDLWEFQ
jgi:hypothetical protein